jgi:hypothetical protein
MYIQFEFATGRKNIVPIQNKTAIKDYIERFKYVDGGVCRYSEIKREDAFMFDCYNRIFQREDQI